MSHKISALLLASLGGLAIAQPARADAPTPVDPSASDTPATPLPPPVVDPATTPPPPPAPTETYVPPPTTYNSTTYNTTYNEEQEHPSMFGYAWREPRLQSEIGVGVSIGGGLSGFTDQMMRDNVSNKVGGLWDFRAAIGTHVPIGIELGYIGTASNVKTFGGAANGTLIGTTAEGAIRYNILPHYVVNPYVFAGVGWQRYDLTDIKFAQADSGMKNQDNVLEVPMGTGLSVRDLSGFTVDVRGTFRAVADSTLLVDPRTGDNAQLHTWEASAALGYEF